MQSGADQAGIDYKSSDDSDFHPGEDPDAADSSGSENEGVTPAARGASATGPQYHLSHTAAQDIGYDDSGDEAVIERRQKRQNHSKRGEAPLREDEEDHVIKTRSMRANEKTAKKYATPKGAVSINVDTIWEQMKAETLIPASSSTSPKQSVLRNESAGSSALPDQSAPAGSSHADDPPHMVRIKRKYNFAGQVHTEEKLVPRDSAEARVYLASLEKSGVDESDASEEASRQMPRKAFRSAFEPAIDLLQPPRHDLNLGISERLKARQIAQEAGAKKMNTVEKSRLDWAGYVDKEGLKEELELAGRSKGSYNVHEDFLSRSVAVREEEARRVRLAANRK